MESIAAECHSFYPYFEGISEAAYEAETLKAYENKTVTYNGREMSVYEATQVQRAIERKIRQAKREMNALKAAELPYDTELNKVKRYQAQMRDFIAQTGLQRQRVREAVYN